MFFIQFKNNKEVIFIGYTTLCCWSDIESVWAISFFNFKFTHGLPVNSEIDQ